MNEGKEYCYQCDEFPCKRIEKLDKRYREKYHMSVIENLENIRDYSLVQFLENEKMKWTCRECGEIICVHDGSCIGCGKKYKK